MSGAAFSTSQAKTLQGRPAARIDTAIPQARPPPPQGMSTVSTSGMSSISSSPIVPLPSVTRPSSNGCTKVPRRSSNRRSKKTCHQRSNETRMTVPPQRSTASTLFAAALSGTMTVHGTPSRCADHATAWPMFPALAVIRPSSSSAGESCATRLVAPRTLNDPFGCRFSSFRRTPGEAVSWSATIGVRMATPAMRSRAALISLSPDSAVTTAAAARSVPLS